MSSKYTHKIETVITEQSNRNSNPSNNQNPEDSSCLGIIFIFLLFSVSVIMCSAATPASAHEPLSNANPIAHAKVDSFTFGTIASSLNTTVNDGIEVSISIWVDKSGSAQGIVPDLSFEQLEPILSIFQELESGSISLGKVGAFTRQDMAFLSFKSSSAISLPTRKPGQTPSQYQKELERYKKRKARTSSGSRFEDKIDRFEAEARNILDAPKNEQSSLICEGLNVTKRQFSQSNVDENTVKIVLILSDMINAGGIESCPMTLGDAELIIVNRLSDPATLLFHSKTHQFISVEEAIDFIVSSI